MVDAPLLPPALAFAGDIAIPLVAIGGGLFVAVVGILCGTVARIVRSRAYETSRREIAAYIAEGSMTPEQGERLLLASNPEDERVPSVGFVARINRDRDRSEQRAGRGTVEVLRG